MREAPFRFAIYLTPITVAVFVACGSGDGSSGNGASRFDDSQTIPGNQPVSTLTGVFPSSGLLGRDLDVMLMGDGTTFDADTKVTLGEDVQVSSLTLVSPTSMSAHLVIGAGARTGPRDVSVQTHGVELVAHHAFNIDEAIDATVKAGFPEQGGLLVIDVRNRDIQSFGKTALVGAVSSLESDDVGGGGPTNSGDSASRASFVGFVDPLAPPGPTRIEAVNLTTSLTGATVYSDTFSSSADALEIYGRRAMEEVHAGQSAQTGQVLAPYSTRVHRMSTPSSGLVSITVTPTGARLVPRLNVYPTSGRSSDFVGSVAAGGPGAGVSLTYPVGAAADTYSVISDVGLGGGGSTYDYVISAGFTPVSVTPETLTPHYASSLAQPVCDDSTQRCLIAARIGGKGEWDVYALPSLPAPSHWVVLVRVESDVRVWLTQDPWLRHVDEDITPTWPSHLATGNVGPGTAPTYLIVQGREGGMAPLGDYLVASSLVSE